MRTPSPPDTERPADEAALLARALSLAGRPLAATAGKGAVGELVEAALGLPRSSAPEPDVKELGIEVKSLPVRDGRVLESTWVCSASPASLALETWASARVHHKLARVLFVPIAIPAPTEAGATRRFGTAFLWSPDEDEERVLRADWEDLADLVAHGLSSALSARRGRALQLRPKAKNAQVRRRRTDLDGEGFEEAPQGFYLRRSFVQAIVDARFPDQRSPGSR